ncbi:uncharacterized protein LOC129742830 [Uranotaenia lowii]|uniref:uncharacterized protein LOC129742830 n=1 Tax=Uranotaenia lowii TaxID=190385 RepID=UPI00247A103B|nr:uncharacterized protein LOC129742830 [Uranotaenia lowii]
MNKDFAMEHRLDKVEERQPQKIKSPLSLADLARRSFVRDLAMVGRASVQQELEQIPFGIMVQILEDMCEYGNLSGDQRKILCQPEVCSRILRYYSHLRSKLIKLFQAMEIMKQNTVSSMVENLRITAEKSAPLEDCHLLGYDGTLQLGSFLVEAGWYEEACVVLEVTLQQSNGRPLHMLQALQPKLIAETITYKHDKAAQTSSAIQSLVASNQLSKSLEISINLAQSIYHYERCEFQPSYEYAITAFRRLDEQECSKAQFVDVFRQLSKCCISRNHLDHGRILIIEAVSRAWYATNAPSPIYASTLEDYAIYLLSMNAVEDSVSVYGEAQRIHTQLYGYYNLYQTVTQSNLRYSLYMRTYVYKNLQIADQYLEYAITCSEQVNHGDPRILAAVRGVRPLQASDRARFGDERSPQQLDEYEKVTPPMAIEEVWRVFDAIKVKA